MNVYDIAIGFIIGVGVERAVRISHKVQEAIAAYNKKRRAVKAAQSTKKVDEQK